MSKKIVLLSDGTGNSSSKLFTTNVWRLYQALDLSDPAGQVAYYDDGVGTSSFKPFAILGGIFGFGLKRNVIDIYSFCCRNYQQGDRLYGFGFSRGAFTIRIVAGFIARIGLVRYNGNEQDLARDAEIAYRQYRQNFRSGANILIGPLRAMRDWASEHIARKPAFEELDLVPVEKIEFLGVWDTVDAYGGPIDEITRAIDYFYWPLSMPDRFLNRKIGRACHALALEEERESFHPVLWDDRYVREGKKLYAAGDDWEPAPEDPAKPLADIDRERISQVWFVGVHSDIGGGYSRAGLSYQALAWMMERAGVYGLRYLATQEAWLRSLVDGWDKLNDSRRGISGYYRYQPRKLADIYNWPPYKLSLGGDLHRIVNLFRARPDPEHKVKAELATPRSYIAHPKPKIHRSVIERIRNGNDGYAPIVLPEQFDVVELTGAIVPNGGIAHQVAHSRANRQEKVWDWVWGRRIIYFLTVLASLFLASLPLVEQVWPGRGAASPAEFVIPIIDLVAAFLPSFATPWLDAFRDSPGRFLAGVTLVGVLMYAGGWFQVHIRDLMRAIWKTPHAPSARPAGIIYRFRSSGAYRAFFYLLKYWILPTVFAGLIFIVLAYAAVMLVNRVSFAAFDLAGNTCTPSENPPARMVVGSDTATFQTMTMCSPTGLSVQRGRSYRINLVVTQKWEDGRGFNESDPEEAKGIETDPRGFGRDKMTMPMWFGLPLRRLLASNWFATIIRIGNKGPGEVVLSLDRQDSGPCQCPATTSYSATFKAGKTGEVFVYVNDAVIGIPGYFNYLYLNNAGAATLTLQQLDGP
ncbi:MAG: DUF2235 domain-containing protein [Bradyrhizobium sp.]|uniref:DUF2235 domain-containing protein n=1 Tax=Bradyrhizobium sp. TaxID=376 RepID=UPI00238673CA|nr:DUF2235 domain-containing protein [Bradyrhizobium sp.]MDE2601618.1 DUF2235 domain-containing protein [Bradyrhizobium sp.]